LAATLKALPLSVQDGQGGPAELDRSSLGLEPDGARNDLNPLGGIDRFAVHPDRVTRPLSQNLNPVPFAGRVFRIRRFRDPGDIPGQRMNALIDDLLKLSRIGRSELRWQGVNLSARAESITADLRKAEPARAVELAVAPNLRAEGDERLLSILLDNLLRNAWKFTRNQPRARIEFGFAPEPEPAFFVRDNGVGFDMAHAGKLFGVFQRLHSISEFPGTGVGLAIVQRIIQRHRGRVWATGVVNQGAAFYFTLPETRDFEL
jgi:signal transduction histidine kinase